MLCSRRFGIASVITLFIVLGAYLPSADSAIQTVGAGDDLKKIEAQLPKGVKLPKGTKLHRVQAGQAGKDGWYDAKSTEGHFRISMPIPFNDTSFAPEQEDPIRSYMIGSKSSEGYTFSAVEMEKKKSAPAKVSLKSLPQSFRDKGQAKVSEERYFEEQGYPAVEFHVSGPKNAADMRFIECPDRLFTLIVEYPVESEAELKPYISKFFKSLEIETKSDEKKAEGK